MIIVSNLTLILICMLGAAFFSGVETGVISIHRMRLRHRVKEGKPEARVLQGFIDNPDRLLGTTLVGTNICVVITSILSASLAGHYLPPRWSEIVSTLGMSALLLVFSEYIPKAWFQGKPMERCNRFAGILHLSSLILRPVSAILTGLTTLFLPRQSKAKGQQRLLNTREELQHLAHEGEQNGVLSHKERVMIHRVFELCAKRAGQIVIPRSDMITVASTATISELFKIARESNFTRMPVYDERTKKFVGIINIFDVLSTQSADSTQKVTDFARTPLFIPREMPVDDILPRLRLSRQPMCLVTDKEAEVVGLITTEDVLEEIVGQL